MPTVIVVKLIMAARLAIDNFDDALRLSFGKARRTCLQASSTVWDYFSTGADGAIHEYAEFQFVHIFASGAAREEARKSLQLALKSAHVT